MDPFALLARYYDVEHANLTEDISLYTNLAERTGGPLLELGSGTGRLTAALARAGYSITGIDHSPEMLTIAERKIEDQRLSDKVSLIQADMRDFRLPNRFPMAFIPLNSFLHLETQTDQLRALRCWQQHLTPSGLLIIDFFHPDPGRLLESDGRLVESHRWTDHATGATIQKFYTQTVDLASQTLHILLMYDETMPDGPLNRTLIPFDLRYIFRFEAALLLEKAGFIVEEVYGSWDLEPFVSESSRMVIVARRVEGADTT